MYHFFFTDTVLMWDPIQCPFSNYTVWAYPKKKCGVQDRNIGLNLAPKDSIPGGLPQTSTKYPFSNDMVVRVYKLLHDMYIAKSGFQAVLMY